MNTEQNYRRWLTWPSMTEELKKDLESMTPEAVSDSFYRSLAFGTGGLRGVLGAGTNKMNVFTVYQATRGLGNYLKEAFPAPSCAISYDSRIHSLDFAELAAAALAEMGIRVWIYASLMPTPMLSYAVRYLRTSAGIMITASHNPAKFNGYKVYGSDGCQITLVAAETIQRCIDAEDVLADALPSFEEGLRSGMIRIIDQDLIESYYTMILGLRVKPSAHPLHVVYSPLYGTGNVPVREVLRRLGYVRLDVVKEQEEPDGLFPTCPYPNPEVREAMTLAIQQTVDSQADLCFATDPDCDRMGAGVRCGNQVTLITGNEMGILMLDYLCRTKRFDASLPPVVVKTIVSTDMAERLCRKYGIELRNVLTGFKFIGEQIGLLESAGQADRFLFGFEESYGYLSGTEVRDKDAVNASLLLCELASDLKAQGKTLTDRLNELREEFGYDAQRLLTFEYEGADGAARMAGIMTALRKPLPDFDDPLIRASDRLDYLTGVSGLPCSDVLQFNLPENRKIIVRPSGTEPKLKAYLFAAGKSPSDSAAQLDQLEGIVNGLCRA